MSQEIANFGGNVRWTPAHFYRPNTEHELLRILEQHRSEQIRAVASLHSWSPVAATQGVTIDMGAFNSVTLAQGAEAVTVRVGAGCTLQRLLDQLRQRSEWTLPTLGAVKLQTIAGAISTGTHGSGAPGLSHHVLEARVARYHPETGEAQVVEITDGEELRAVRCGLGCTGILVEVRLRCKKRYLVRESLKQFQDLDGVLQDNSDHPLSYFCLAPYSGHLIAWRRSEVPWRDLSFPERLKARLYRAYKYFTTDLFFHWLIGGLKHMGLGAHKQFFQALPKLLLLNKAVLDESEPQLTLEHHLFRHIETEVFVPMDRLPLALEILTQATSTFAGDDGALSEQVTEILREDGSLKSLLRQRGSYRHHYLFVFRRVLPEDTMISMASGEQIWYSLSVFSYSRKLDSYENYCLWLAGVLNRVVGARLHWGKHCPLDHTALAPRYPELERFKELCLAHDPKGAFRNQHVNQVLGF